MRLIGLLAALLMPAAAMAGESSQSAADALPTPQTQAFSRALEETLAGAGVQVALVGRLARDPGSLPDGVRYTHVGFWVYSESVGPDGQPVRGYRALNLYQRADQPTRSDLVVESPAQFFAGATVLDAGVIIPDRQLQARLLAALAGPAVAEVHNPNYSLISNPSSDLYQNCTEHALNVIVAALYGTTDMDRIKANIAAHFEPQELRLNPLLTTFGPVFSDGVRLDDQGQGVHTATFSSIARFLQAHDLGGQVFRHTAQGAVAF